MWTDKFGSICIFILEIHMVEFSISISELSLKNIHLRVSLNYSLRFLKDVYPSHPQALHILSIL